MTTVDLSNNDNKKINILILTTLLIVLLIFVLLVIYRYGFEYKSKIFNNIIYALIIIYILLILITSVLYIRYRYDYGENILDNIDIIVKPIVSVLFGLVVALFLIGSKNIIDFGKKDINDVRNLVLIISESRNINLTNTPGNIPGGPNHPPSYEQFRVEQPGVEKAASGAPGAEKVIIESGASGAENVAS